MKVTVRGGLEGQAQLVVSKNAPLQLHPRRPGASGAPPSARPQADQGEPGRGQGAAGQVALATTISDTQHSHPELPRDTEAGVEGLGADWVGLRAQHPWRCSRGMAWLQGC